MKIMDYCILSIVMESSDRLRGKCKLRHWQFRVELLKVYEHGLGLGPFSSLPDFDLLSNFQIYPISLVDHKKRAGGGSERLGINLALKDSVGCGCFSLL